MVDKEKKISDADFVKSAFIRILTMFTNLLYLNCNLFGESRLPRLLFGPNTPTFFSSTLMELHIKVSNFEDCLYLLDGRLKQLHTLYVNIWFVGLRPFTIYKKVRYLGRSK
jgi:hypothetical protein